VRALRPVAAPEGGAAAGQARRDLGGVLLWASVLLAWDFSGGDIALARWFGTAQGFAWRDHWFTAGLMHGGMRALGWVLLALLVLNVWRPLAFGRALSRPERLRWLGLTLLCALLIPLVKHGSATSCPWSLAEFGGGAARYVPHWVPGLSDGGPGGCFPSGHASTAFSFIVGWFALRERAPTAARRWLLASLLMGAALGWTQVMRGAHYLSHPLWTAWICWTVGVVGSARRTRARPEAAATATDSRPDFCAR
jgi:membrane-associated PAP2 superfamily phosphatase